MILVVAATERELELRRGRRAAASAESARSRPPSRQRARSRRAGRTPCSTSDWPARADSQRVEAVIGAEAVYADAAGAAIVPARARPDPGLLAAARRALPAARVCAIATTARVGGSTGFEVEAMEGFAVLRACELAAVPAVEVRVVVNDVDEPDRARWRFDEGFALLRRDRAGAARGARCLSSRRRCLPPSARSGS